MDILMIPSIKSIISTIRGLSSEGRIAAGTKETRSTISQTRGKTAIAACQAGEVFLVRTF
jgi:hypothetical protein